MRGKNDSFVLFYVEFPKTLEKFQVKKNVELKYVKLRNAVKVGGVLEQSLQKHIELEIICD